MRFLMLALLIGCTENGRAKAFGGTMKVDLPCNSKLTEVTWKEAELWYATRPMREGEQPEVTSFKEDSSYGMLEGEVILTERACK